MTYRIDITVNGQAQQLEVEPQHTLLRVLRERLGLTGAKNACATGECGACSVLVNGELVTACLVLVVECHEAEVVTIEGLAQTDETMAALQQAFLDHNGAQCGFCTSGMLMSAAALLKRTSRPDEEEIRANLVGNLCRCTGYADIIKSVQVASRMRRTEH